MKTKKELEIELLESEYWKQEVEKDVKIELEKLNDQSRKNLTTVF